MSRQTFGYVRVSTKNQKEDRQLAAMKDFGIPDCRIVVEKQSGKDFDRPLYLKLVQSMRQGDVLVVKSIDRLGRNYSEILDQWASLTREKGVAIVVLDMPLLDTRTDRDLTGVLVADIVLQLLSYVAQTERDFLHQRQTEGIAAARERGVHFGRSRLDMPQDFCRLAKAWQEGQISAAEASRLLGVSRNTFIRRVRE